MYQDIAFIPLSSVFYIPMTTHNKKFPNESKEYRKARNELLQDEIELRLQIENVAKKRRNLPLGGLIKEDYIFEEIISSQIHKVKLSALFENDKKSLVMYSFMYGPHTKQACPMCTSLIDSLDGAAPHITDRINLAIVAKAPIEKIQEWADIRKWKNLRLLSSYNNKYNLDYFAEDIEQNQLPSINIFQKTADGICHFYNTELFFISPENGQDPRHADLIWPLWNVFDLCPEGRGSSWYPKLSYS